MCSLKLMFSGMTIGSLTMSQFSGSDFGMAIAALGGIYHLDKMENNKKIGEK